MKIIIRVIKIIVFGIGTCVITALLWIMAFFSVTSSSETINEIIISLLPSVMISLLAVFYLIKGAGEIKLNKKYSQKISLGIVILLIAILTLVTTLRIQ